MRIECDKCAAKYSIADEKVRGKTFKIRCKKCSNVIIVRDKAAGAEDAAASEPASADEPAGWHLAINGDTVGPLSEDEVRRRYDAGQVDKSTSVWQEGFEDWLELGQIEAFADLPDRAPAAAALGGGLGLGASSPAADDPFASSGSDDAFSAGSGSNFDGGGFGDPIAAAAPAAAAAAEESPRVDSLTGQRNENSVLFSLDSLKAMASTQKPSSAGPVRQAPSTTAPSSEGSGSDRHSCHGRDDGHPVFGRRWGRWPRRWRWWRRRRHAADLRRWWSRWSVRRAPRRRASPVCGPGRGRAPALERSDVRDHRVARARLDRPWRRVRDAPGQGSGRRDQGRHGPRRGRGQGQGRQGQGRRGQGRQGQGRRRQGRRRSRGRSGRSGRDRGRRRARDRLDRQADRQEGRQEDEQQQLDRWVELQHGRRRQLVELEQHSSGTTAAPKKADPDVDCLLDPNLPKCKGGGKATPDKAAVDPSLPPSSAPPRSRAASIRSRTRPRPAVPRTALQREPRSRSSSRSRARPAASARRRRPASTLGTALGKCVEAAAKKAKFPKFQADQQGFQFNFRM